MNFRRVGAAWPRTFLALVFAGRTIASFELSRGVAVVVEGAFKLVVFVTAGIAQEPLSRLRRCRVNVLHLHEEDRMYHQAYRLGQYALFVQTGSKSTPFKNAGTWPFAGHAMIACSTLAMHDVRYAELGYQDRACEFTVHDPALIEHEDPKRVSGLGYSVPQQWCVSIGAAQVDGNDAKRK